MYIYIYIYIHTYISEVVEQTKYGMDIRHKIVVKNDKCSCILTKKNCIHLVPILCGKQWL